MVNEIPKEEFQARIKKLQAAISGRGLDVLIAYGNEAEPANLRYLSNYWPAFETGAVAVPKEGRAILLIGPESLAYAKGRSRIKEIRQLLPFRESAEPEYPGKKLTTFTELFDELSGGKGVKRLGIAGWPILTMPVYGAMTEALAKSGGKLERADDLVNKLRMIKSKSEIEVLRVSFKAAKAGFEAVLEEIKPGMTECECVGIAQGAIYANGAESEGHPLYVLSGPNSSMAISRATHRKLKTGEIIQLNIGARVAGYASSIGRPIVLGKIQEDVRELMSVGIDSHRIIVDSICAGVPAREVAEKYYAFIRKRGLGHMLLYGPCHGLGLMECEWPWMETSSNYLLEENMTFQVDAFLHDDKRGTRWEDGIVVTKKGAKLLDDMERKIICIY